MRKCIVSLNVISWWTRLICQTAERQNARLSAPLSPMDPWKPHFSFSERALSSGCVVSDVCQRHKVYPCFCLFIIRRCLPKFAIASLKWILPQISVLSDLFYLISVFWEHIQNDIRRLFGRRWVVDSPGLRDWYGYWENPESQGRNPHRRSNVEAGGRSR